MKYWERFAAQLSVEKLTEQEKRQAILEVMGRLKMQETLILIIKCNAPDGLFEGDFDDLSSEHQKLFIGPDRVICDSGTMGRWCLECRFGDVKEEREEIEF